MGETKATLFKPDVATQWGYEPTRGPIYGGGSRRYRGENPPNGAVLHYLLPAQVKEKAKLEVYDIQGDLVRTLEGSADAGWHKLVWDFRRGPTGGDASRPADSAGQPGAVRRGGGAGNRGGQGGPREGQVVPAGEYRIELKVEGEVFKQTLRIENDPSQPRPLTETGSD